MIVKQPRHINIDVMTREILRKTSELKAESKQAILNGYKSDTPTLDKCTYETRSYINRKGGDYAETARRIDLLNSFLAGAKKGLNMVGDILITMLEISEEASAIYIGEPNPSFLEHNIHLKRLKEEFYSVTKLYKIADIPLFTIATSNTTNCVNIDYNIHMDSDGSTRIFYETPKILDESVAIGGVAANRPTISVDRVAYNNVETTYIVPAVPPVAITTDIYKNNIIVIEECINRVNNYKLELDKLTTRVELRKREIDSLLCVLGNSWRRDMETDRELEERISNNRFLMKKPEYNI